MTGDGVAVEAAEHLATLAPGPDHLRLAEDPQVPAHARLAHLAEVGELGDAHLRRRREALDDEQPRRGGQPLEADREVARPDGDAPRERTARWPGRRVRTHKGIFHKGSLMNARPSGIGTQ